MLLRLTGGLQLLLRLLCSCSCSLLHACLLLLLTLNSPALSLTSVNLLRLQH